MYKSRPHRKVGANSSMRTMTYYCGADKKTFKDAKDVDLLRLLSWYLNFRLECMPF